ncbi:TonB-dependent siderophore receptor [Sphingomonas xinjiangensis]|uniref:Outer membrane receptor for ferric coprogen and ferric-rhodotorulic acid n=1 Tax=Sphingomonas xinjiangensis TaxID=643568 RepID=A0A840YC25_9SPHN|nr:TonB-dependent siderophore receptor [Sphingomonas xinjiangensis]MBB5709845.1 outer membrane receptor for ferric coprogen and ferric-rhodotorulic acid [Sphingomonas xinjiangensis]
MLGLPLIATPAFAQTEDEEHSRRSDIVVTGVREDDSYAPQQATVAGKSPAPLIEIPQSVSVVTRQQIEDRNLFTIGEAVQTVAGVTVMPFDGTNPDYRARGFVLDYAYDGIPSTFSSGVPEFDLVIYERLEVQRGPTGLFRGSGSPGGTINLIRKRGQDQLALSGALSAGSWNNYRGEFDIGGPVDAAGRLRLRAVGALHDRNFFQNKSHTRKLTAYTALDFDLTPTTTIGASLSYQDTVANTPMNGQPAYGLLSNGQRHPLTDQFLNFPRNFQHLPSWNKFAETTTEYAGEIKQQVGDWSVVVRGLHRDIPRAWADAFIEPGTGVDPVTLTAAYVNRRSRGVNGKTSVDAYATGPFRLFGQEHELAVGYSWDKRTTSFRNRSQNRLGRYSIYDADSIPLPGAAFTSGSETDLQQSGVHAQLRLRPTKDLTIVAGGRISDYTNKSRSIVPSPATNFTTGARERGQFTPSVGAVLHLTDDVTLYGSYSDIFNPQTQLRADGTVLDPRVGQQYEAGLKGRFLDGALNASAAVFRSKDKNRALADTANPGFYVQVGEVKIQGFEFEVTGSPLAGLDLVASYTNVKTEFELGTAAQTGAVFDLNTPRHQYKFYARYAPAALGGAFAAVSLNGQSGVVAGGVPGIREQAPVAVVGGQLGWRVSDDLRAFVSVNNVFDKVYYQRVGSINTYNFYGEPRNVLVTLRASY